MIRLKKKLLYFMSVDWNWIAQRPHFMALELAKEYDVTVLYPRYLHRPWEGQRNVKAPEKCYGVPQIPFQENFAVLQRMGNLIFRKYIGDIHAYDFVWLGTPMFARLIPDDYRGTVVYDYMDDIAALQSSDKVAAYVRTAHESLLKRADLIMVTSRYLMNGLDEEAGKKAHLIRNAFRSENDGTGDAGSFKESDARRKEPDSPEKQNGGSGRDKRIRIGYVGTISGWMDFPLLMESLREFPGLEYHMWGPSGTTIPEHERLIIHGVIEHDRIRDAIRDMDCLIMPFQVNDIVLAVDPVKLYEYISFGKNVIAVRYPEIERFEPYVWMYGGRDEYFSLIRDLLKGDLPVKYDETQQKEFLASNSWEARGERVRELLGESADRAGKLLSICVPSYNAEKYLRKCLTSLVSHGLADKEEILVIDDGSTDGTAQIGMEYEQKYPGIVRLIRQKNKGHGGAVNTGIRNASGLYFKNIDSDDWVDPAALERLIRSIMEYRELPDVISSDYQEVSLTTGEVTYRKMSGKAPCGRILELGQVNRCKGSFTIHSMTIRTDILKEMRVGLQTHTFYVDCEYMMFPVSRISTVFFSDDAVYQYARDNTEQSVDIRNMIQRFDQHERVVKRLVAFEKRTGMNPEQRVYYEQRLREVVSTHYALCLINDEDRVRGCARAEAFDKWLGSSRPDLAKWMGRHMLALRIARMYRFDPVRMEKSFLIKGKDILSERLAGRNS